MADAVTKNLGVVTAYKYAKLGGYTGTEEQFEALLANVDTYAAAATAAASSTSSDLASVQSLKTATETAAGNAATSATAAAASATAAAGSESTISGYATAAAGSATSAAGSAADALASKNAAAASATAASTSETNAADSASTATTAATSASGSATSASGSAATAQTAATTATTKATEASSSATSSATSASSALGYKNQAESAKETAVEAATSASNSALSAGNSEAAAEGYKDTAQSYAVGTNGSVRQGDATDNAKYYKEQAALSASAASESATSADSSASTAATLVAEAEEDIQTASEIIARADEAIDACEQIEEELDLKFDKANVTQSKTINTAGYAIDAREANPSISGSMANDIEDLFSNVSGIAGQVTSINNSLSNYAYKGIIRSTSVLDLSNPGIYYASGATNAPVNGNGIVVFSRYSSDYKTWLYLDCAAGDIYIYSVISGVASGWGQITKAYTHGVYGGSNSFTVSTGVSISRCRLFREGNVVIFTARLKATVPIATDTQLGTLAVSNCFPSYSIDAAVAGPDASGYVWIQQDGKIFCKLNNAITEKYIGFTLTWAI